jgi:hypothetical protein
VCGSRQISLISWGCLRKSGGPRTPGMLDPDAYPSKFRMQVVNVIEYTVGPFSTVLYITLAAVLMLLVIACCNVAKMLLARKRASARDAWRPGNHGGRQPNVCRDLFPRHRSHRTVFSPLAGASWVRDWTGDVPGGRGGSRREEPGSQAASASRHGGHGNRSDCGAASGLNNSQRSPREPC